MIPALERVHEVEVAELYAPACQNIVGVGDELLLPVGVGDIVGIVAVRNGKVCINALHGELIYLYHFGYLVSAFLGSIMLETYPAHACVYLDMTADRGGSILHQLLSIFCGDHALNDIVHGDLMGILGRSIAEDEDIRIGCELPYSNSLVEI